MIDHAQKRAEAEEGFKQKRVEFIPQHECDHGGYIKNDMCYRCGRDAHLCEWDIAERAHKQKIRHLEELKNHNQGEGKEDT